MKRSAFVNWTLLAAIGAALLCSSLVGAAVAWVVMDRHARVVETPASDTEGPPSAVDDPDALHHFAKGAQWRDNDAELVRAATDAVNRYLGATVVNGRSPQSDDGWYGLPLATARKCDAVDADTDQTSVVARRTVYPKLWCARVHQSGDRSRCVAGADCERIWDGVYEAAMWGERDHWKCLSVRVVSESRVDIPKFATLFADDLKRKGAVGPGLAFRTYRVNGVKDPVGVMRVSEARPWATFDRVEMAGSGIPRDVEVVCRGDNGPASLLVEQMGGRFASRPIPLTIEVNGARLAALTTHNLYLTATCPLTLAGVEAGRQSYTTSIPCVVTHSWRGPASVRETTTH